jgi:hypothetical protein
MQRAGEGSRVTGLEDFGAGQKTGGADLDLLRPGTMYKLKRTKQEAAASREGGGHSETENKRARAEADEPTKPLEDGSSTDETRWEERMQRESGGAWCCGLARGGGTGRGLRLGAAWDRDGLLRPAGLGVEGDAGGSGLDDAGGKKRGGITFENNLTVQIRLMD